MLAQSRLSRTHQGQSLVEVSIALALVAIVVLGALTLFSGQLSGLYTSITCGITHPTTPNPCGTTSINSQGLPTNGYQLTGASATFLNPNLQVNYSGAFNTFIGGNQCTPDCPFGAKFIGVPNFVTGPGPLDLPANIDTPSFDAYAYGTVSGVGQGIISILDKNQCTYGAVAEWLTIHQAGTPNAASWSPDYIHLYLPIHDNAGAMYQRAVDAGYTVSATPLSGAMVVYKAGWAGSTVGHIATVVGVSADGLHYTVVEQNVLYLELNDESGAGYPPYRWNTGGFDIRTAAFPDPEIASFIYGPPGTVLPTDPAIITGYVGPSPTPTATPSPT